MQGKPLGRIEIVLFSDVAPLAAENARRLFTGAQPQTPQQCWAGFLAEVAAWLSWLRHRSSGPCCACLPSWSCGSFPGAGRLHRSGAHVHARACSHPHAGEHSPSHTLRGAPFYRIIHTFIDQTGIHQPTSALGGQFFADDAGGLQLKHDRKVGCAHAWTEGGVRWCEVRWRCHTSTKVNE